MPQDAGRRTNDISRMMVTIFAFNAISALLFIHFSNRPAYDDQFNISDVHRYVTQGVSVATIRSIKNAPGPVSYVWMAAAVRFLGGEELRDARIGALASWVLLVAAISIGARYSSFAELWCGGVLTALVFPHSVEATALVLTEGPALLFAVLGAFAWVEFIARPRLTPGVLLLGIAGGLSMGLAVAARQYYLALLPAAMIVGVWQSRTRGVEDRGRWHAAVISSIVVAAAPVVVLIVIWKGLSSPGIATGSSYPALTARIGFAVWRPLIAVFYVAFYLLPLTFPAMLQLKPTRRWRAIAAALGAGTTAGYFSSAILQWGPLRTLVHFLAKGETGQAVVFGLVAAVTTYNAIAITHLLWDRRSAALSCPPVAFALLTILLFVAEQVGVGGTSLLYDRYVLQVAPFLGLIAFWLFPALTRARALTLVLMSVVSHIMLWRFALGAHGP